MTAEEVAAILDISVNTLKGRNKRVSDKPSSRRIPTNGDANTKITSRIGTDRETERNDSKRN